MDDSKMIEVHLGRIVLRDGADSQHIYLVERGGGRGFPIVIGTPEAAEIHRIVRGIKPLRPLTHQLAISIVEKLGARVVGTDIVDLRQETFYARLVVQSDGSEPVRIDARPSDAIALALRAGAPLRVSEAILEQVRTDESGPDPLPDPEDMA